MIDVDVDLPPFERIRHPRRAGTSEKFECGGKKQFFSVAAARRSARLMELSGHRVHDYFCEWCHYWHVGHSEF